MARVSCQGRPVVHARPCCLVLLCILRGLCAALLWPEDAQSRGRGLHRGARRAGLPAGSVVRVGASWKSARVRSTYPCEPAPQQRVALRSLELGQLGHVVHRRGHIDSVQSLEVVRDEREDRVGGLRVDNLRV